jgi:hypothetical protein
LAALAAMEGSAVLSPSVAPIVGHVGQAITTPLALPSGPATKETGRLFWVLSLCLSRACLGKMIHFYTQMAKKQTVLLPAVVVSGIISLPAEMHLLFWVLFPYVCPEPVLAKRSFIYKNGIAKGRVPLPEV